jgi:phosphate:Na+ symporter
MADQVLGPILDNNPALLPHIHDEEERVDALVAQIHDYLIKVGQQQISQERMREVYLMLHVSVQLEGMADVIDKELRPLAAKKIRDGVHFSANGRNEIEAFHLKMLKQISRAIEVFTDSSLEGAKRMKKKQAKYDQLDVNFRQAHFERLKNAVSESVESSGAHLDVMDGLNKITLYATSIAKAIIAQDSNGGATVTVADSSR